MLLFYNKKKPPATPAHMRIIMQKKTALESCSTKINLPRTKVISELTKQKPRKLLCNNPSICEREGRGGLTETLKVALAHQPFTIFHILSLRRLLLSGKSGVNLNYPLQRNLEKTNFIIFFFNYCI